jgi:hypothetical protein
MPSTLLLSEDHAMGKTLPPFSSLIEQERHRWMPFKKALPKADQPIFNQLFECAKLHIQAGVMVARPWAFGTIVMAIVLEQQKQVERLESLLDELQRRGEA